MSYCEFIELRTLDSKLTCLALEAIGFNITTTINGWDAHNGGFGVRLVPASSEEEISNITLSYDTRSPSDTLKDLVKKTGKNIEIIADEKEHDCEYLLCNINPELDIRLLWTYNEDDKGELPELPKTIPWSESADLGIRGILAYIPLAFRKKSRQRITRVAEEFATEDKTAIVQDKQAINGIIFSTPAFDHKSLKRAINRFFNYEPWIDESFMLAAAEQGEQESSN